VLESLRFYEALGFWQAPVGETWQHPYAVVTDGRAHLGLHGYSFDSPALTWVLPDLRRHVPRLEALESFNELGFLSPDGQMIALLEARTYSPAGRPPQQPSLLDWFEEILLPCSDKARSSAFWERLGFVAVEESDDSLPRVGLTSDSIDIALTTHPAVTEPLLVFKAGDLTGRRERIAAAGIQAARLPRGLDPLRLALLRSPEGTGLLVIGED
jgi:hypothetical protein